MKYIARVEKILQTGIHKLVTHIRDGELIMQAMPLPDFLEIHATADAHALLYRYRDDGAFCGDSWHENLEAAMEQAKYEYGIHESEWRKVTE
jgi:hypothetical protein